MIVKDVIEYLKQYPEDEEIIIAWWDKTHIEDNTFTKVKESEWSNLVRAMDNRDWSDVSDDINYSLSEMREN